MGAALRRIGARIAFSWNAFSVHMSHPPAVDDGTKARGSAKNFIRLIEEHPELVGEAPDWAEITAARITRWQQGFGSADPKLSEIARSARAAKSKRTGTDVTVYTGVTGGYDRVRPARRGVATRHLLFSDRAGRGVRLGDARFRSASARSDQDRKGAEDTGASISGGLRVERLDRRQSRADCAGAKPQLPRSNGPAARSACSATPKGIAHSTKEQFASKRGKDAVDRISAQLHRYKDRGFPRQFDWPSAMSLSGGTTIRRSRRRWRPGGTRSRRAAGATRSASPTPSGARASPIMSLATAFVDVRSDKRFVYHLHDAEMKLRSSAEA